MKRIGILTAGGDTPALNATLLGAVHKANECGIELVGLLSGFQALYRADVPHLLLNPGLTAIPELDATRGGTILGSSRTYVDQNDPKALAVAFQRLNMLNLDGLICVGGDGTLNAVASDNSSATGIHQGEPMGEPAEVPQACTIDDPDCEACQ